MANINVTKITTKNVTTKFGVKPTYSFCDDNSVWYNLGFTKPTFVEGDEITCDVVTGKYGNEVDGKKVTVQRNGGGAAPSASPAITSKAPAPAYGGGGKVFPIPALHGDRSIVRQNALTNARECWVASHGGKIFTPDANAIIELARQFEAYSCGDLDNEMAKKIAAERVKAAREADSDE